VIAGSLSEGIQQVVGPFWNEADATNYAETYNMGHFDKNIVEVEEPPPVPIKCKTNGK
jgi:hypothetical protein